MLQGVEDEQKNTPAYNSVLEKLMLLVDNSLLMRLPAAGEQVRFMMLETLREYVLERLIAKGELEWLRDWHACYYLGVVEAAELGLRGPQQLLWLARLDEDLDNIRAALEWLLLRAKDGVMVSAPAFFEGEGKTSTGIKEERLSSKPVPGAGLPAIVLCLRLAAALRPYWEWQGYLTEGRGWLGAALTVPLAEEAGEMALKARAKALSEAARLWCLQNDQAQSVALAEESIALWRQLDNLSGLATALLHRGWAAHAMGENELAKSLYLEGMELLSPAGDRWLRAQILCYLAAAAGFTSDFDQMRSYYRQGVELFEQVGDTIAVADFLKDQGGITILEGNYTEAIDCLVRSIRLCYELGHKQFVATGLGSLSYAVGLRGEPEPVLASIYSARIGGAAESLSDRIGLTPWTKTNSLAQLVRQFIRSRVDEESYKAAWAEGRALTVEQAVDLACQMA
jgi:tetratricopeptide (TPR) repeat protein